MRNDNPTVFISIKSSYLLQATPLEIQTFTSVFSSGTDGLSNYYINQHLNSNGAITG